MKKYNEKEVKRILKQDLTLPQEVDEKVYEAYGKLSGKTYQAAGRISCRKWILAGTAAAMLAASTLGVMAAGGFFTKDVKEEGKTLSYDFEIDYELTAGEVTAVPKYIPEGYTEYEEGKYDKDGMHQNGISICPVDAAWLDSAEDMLATDHLLDMETTTLDNMEAHVLTLDWNQERAGKGFDKRVYLFNPEEGYVVVVFGGNDLPMEELKKVADNLDIQVDLTKPQTYVSEEEKDKERAAEEEWQKRQKQTREDGVSADQMHRLGEAFRTALDDAVVTVESVKLVDSLAGYDTADVADYEELSYWLNEDGSLKDYERLTSDFDTQEERSRENVGQKFLEVKVKAENPSAETIDYWAGAGKLARLVKQADGTYAYPDASWEAVDTSHSLIQSAGYPVYFDKACNTGENRNHFFYRELAPGETLEYTLLYVVDEDMADELYLNYNVSEELEDDSFVDVSVK